MISYMARRSSAALALLLPLAPLLLSACIVGSHPAGIASSSSPVYVNYTVLGPGEESSCTYRILIFPIGGKDPTEQLIEKAVKTQGGDALAGVTVELRSSTLFLPLAGKECTIVKGLVVKNVR
ncbi:MAG: hypothetical protein ACREI9_08585 [Nitrospiraceae bacterium]